MSCSSFPAPCVGAGCGGRGGSRPPPRCWESPRRDCLAGCGPGALRGCRRLLGLPWRRVVLTGGSAAGKSRGGPVSSPSPFAASPRAALERGRGGAGAVPPTLGEAGPARLSAELDPLLSISMRVTIPLVSPFHRDGDKAQSRGEQLGPHCGRENPTVPGGTPAGTRPAGRAGAGRDGPGRGWRGGGAGREAGAWIRPQLSLLTLRARRRTAGSSQAARYQTSTKEANGSSP